MGESGSGKSVTALSILQLLPYPQASHPTGSIRFDGRELVGAAPRPCGKMRGDRIAMIFQEPMTSLNPLHSIERQVNETLMLHKGLIERAARARARSSCCAWSGCEEPEQRLQARIRTSSPAASASA